LSHDLRAPLRSIRAFAQILGESLAGKLDTDQTDALDRVLQGSQRMVAMLDELLELLRIGAYDAPRAAVDATGVLAGVLENLRGDAAAAGAQITSGKLPSVHTSRTLLGQILQNLISNAIKFRGDQAPVVQIAAQRRPDAWEFAIRDNGVGILPEDRERVF